MNKFTPTHARDFLDALASGHTVVHACRTIGITPQAVYKRRARDAAFATAWAEAEEYGVQVLEQEARRRAVDGVDKMVVSAGKLLGMERQYSDALLTLLLKAKRPEVYRDTVNIEVYIRQAAIAAGIDPDAAVAEAQAILKEAKATR